MLPGPAGRRASSRALGDRRLAAAFGPESRPGLGVSVGSLHWAFGQGVRASDPDVGATPLQPVQGRHPAFGRGHRGLQLAPVEVSRGPAWRTVVTYLPLRRRGKDPTRDGFASHSRWGFPQRFDLGSGLGATRQAGLRPYIGAPTELVLAIRAGDFERALELAEAYDEHWVSAVCDSGPVATYTALHVAAFHRPALWTSVPPGLDRLYQLLSEKAPSCSRRVSLRVRIVRVQPQRPRVWLRLRFSLASALLEASVSTAHCHCRWPSARRRSRSDPRPGPEELSVVL